MEKNDILTLLAVAAGAYILFKVIGTREEKLSSIKSSMDSFRYPTQEEIKREWTAGKSSLISQKGTTTYFFNEEDLSNLNLAQRLLLNIGVSPKWVLE